MQDVAQEPWPTWICRVGTTTDEIDGSQKIADEEIETTVVLATACVRLQSGLDISKPCRALMDTGAQLNLITNDCVNQLCIPAIRCNQTINGVTGGEIITSKVKVFIKSIHDDRLNLPVELFVINKQFCGFLPTVELRTMVPTGIELADPRFRIPAEVQLLLGADVWAHVQGNVMYRHPDGTLLLETSLGYIVFGRVVLSLHKNKPYYDLLSYALQADHSMRNLNRLMEKFWSIEEAPDQKSKLTAEEHAVETYFAQTHYRQNDGRYVVKIPLKENTFPIADSRNISLRRFHQLERYLHKHADEKKLYVDFMRTYERLGHMMVADRKPPIGRTVYIPHHAIKKSIEKFRVVFDASSLNVNRISFNKMQMIGPKLQLDLQDQILCFRKHRVSFIADVTKMFRQVMIDPSQWDLQRIFWRENPDLPLKEYCLTTVTYGMASSVFNSVRAMIQCARDNRTNHPLAAKAIEECFYIDDGLMGAASIAEAIQLAKQVDIVLKSGGFVLRNWASNCRELVTAMSAEINSGTIELNDDKETNETKVLGLKWLTENDEMAISVNTDGILDANTKRKMLSIIAGLYDPNGFIAPIVVVAKIIMQDLWRNPELDWDSILPQNVIKQWQQFCMNLHLLKEFKIPRWLKIHEKSIVQLHGFADASARAYGAVIYVRTIDSLGKINCILLCAKSRVAPLKSLTIPRLELEAAQLLSIQLHRVMKTCNLEKIRYFLWTDSSIVLHWINKVPIDLKLYVSNRVAKIQELTKKHAWQHVSSEDNPADLVSRGLNAADFLKNAQWLNGPKWLLTPESRWPESKIILSSDHKTQMEKECKSISARVHLIAPLMYRNSNDTLIRTISSWRSLLRITGYVMRFINNVRAQIAKKRRKKDNQIKRIDGIYIFGPELEMAANYWIRVAQAEHYKGEIEALKNKDDRLPPRSKIASLRPFLDKNGTLRVGGRISNARCSFNKKHPVIVPPKSRVGELIMKQSHMDTLHGGVQIMMAYIRNNYWMPRLRSELRLITLHCVTCIRQAGKTSEQIMADLPMDRVVPARPFVKCGVDLAGPFDIRLTDRINTATRNRQSLNPELKGYAVVFVCLVTRAVHLEAVMSLSAEAFLTAYKRFVARRGTCEYMYSDNGTNFVRANKELRAAVNSWKDKNVQDYVGWNGTKWTFITPSASHQGGLWEAAVKQMKVHLKRVIGPEKYTYEAMSTLLAEVEACMNSRPICAMADDPDDLTALTPAHFLIGEPLKLPLPLRHEHPPKMAVGLYKQLQARINSFWEKWSTDYLSSLINRPKWKTEQENIRVGQLVLIKSEIIAPTYWAMGRIIAVKKSDDGCVRSARIKVFNGEIERPIQKLIVLPVDEELAEYH